MTDVTYLGPLVSVYLNLLSVKKPSSKVKKVIAAIEDELMHALKIDGA